MSPALLDLNQLTQLPRPIYGQAESLPNHVLDFWHSHPWVQFSYALQGVLEVKTASGRYIAPPQRGIWIPQGIEHRVTSQPQTVVRSLYIDSAAAPWGSTDCRVLEVNLLLRELIRAFSQLPIEYDEDSAAGRLASVLLDQLAAAPKHDLMLPLPEDSRLKRITEQLSQHPENPTTLEQWAEQLTVSSKTLSRLFIKETGLAFREWRQRLRLLSALSLLEQQQPVTEVAFSCGYESVSAFIAAFKQLFSATPKAFFDIQT
ncbi:AraC family transcriptional regulator [Thiopseudomonas alkaliphila]|uniref:AraC family transcriptional regulator n=1 Tax=Thiopseudomonas alkaliphila TaxID=1697053 RepID=UPI002575C88A|nr:helix-turn-helix transcriptional regulator [Thiopseudomonas alkaliphila]MDM1708659.1 helix-turn-helix transcriptional regulator [Thiopseudomonas alkaliphila]